MGRRLARRLVAVLAAGVALTMVQPASAQQTDTQQQAPKPPKQPGLLKKMDANKDGVVTRDEFMRYADGLFARMDADKDGTVSHDEFLVAGHRIRKTTEGSSTQGQTTAGDSTKTAEPQSDARRDAQFKQINKSASGSMTRTEWDAWAATLFAEHDMNNDGKLTAEEFGKLKLPRVTTKKPK